MGAEREDTDPQKKAGTEPGLGPGTGQKASSGAAKSAPKAAEDPAPVDFDALHAALGDPLDLEELPEAAEDGADSARRVGESQGRSSATYSSARPHTIPPTRAPNEDLNAPAVIVASDDTVPTAPPNMTVPLAAGAGPRLPAGAPPGSGPHPAAPPSSGPHLAAGYPQTPQSFPVQRQAQLTMRMAERPNRRPKSPTIVVRQRGPSTRQKFLAFAAMLVVVTSFGIAVVFWQKPEWIGLDTKPAPAPSGATSGATASLATAATPPGTATPTSTTTTATSTSTAASTPTTATTAAAGAAAAGATTAATTPVVTAAPPKKRPPAPPAPRTAQ